MDMAAVTSQHASANTVMHCLYGYYMLGIKKAKLAVIYRKDPKTIANWITRSEERGNAQRLATKQKLRKFSKEQQQWVIKYFQERPLSFLDEAKSAFEAQHGLSISVTSVWAIVHSAGLTWKTVERRAIHIKESDIFRFVRELSAINWSQQNVVFLDEVSFDNREMLRKRGYALKGTKLLFRGEFTRKPRVSLLCFIGAGGLLSYYDTEGTFDRAQFVENCDSFARGGKVQMYPGRNSVWIMDGAAIHTDPEIVHHLRSLGIVPIFLPAYCPF